MLSSERKLLIAHRGVSAVYPENTMPAFQEAINVNADMIECDVQLSSDGIPVIFHDTDLARISGISEKVSTKSAGELTKCNAGSWKDSEFSHVTIPLLEELLSLAANRTPLNLELKVHDQQKKQQLVKAVCEIIRKFDMEDQVILSSFDYVTLLLIKENYPHQQIGLLYNKMKSKYFFPTRLINQLSPVTFHCSVDVVKAGWLRRLKEAALPVLVYTVNDKQLANSLFAMGVRGVFTDNPALLQPIHDK